MSLYIPIYEIYGMSECTGPQTVNIPGKHKTGTCGPKLEGSDMKIADPDKDGNGEICYRGRHIMMGYMHNESSTSEAIDEDGWLHSGDIGKMDGDYLLITGRIKELLITAGGENIPPVIIEDEIRKFVGSIVSNIMVVGDRKKFLTCVFTLKAQANPNVAYGEYPFTDDVATPVKKLLESLGSNASTIADAAKDEKLLKWLQEGLDKANKNAMSQAQKIQKFIIVLKDFTLEGNELTPTMKLKRRIVVEKYNADIEKMYEVKE